MLPLHFKERTGPQWAGQLEGQGGLWGTWYLCPVGDGREDGRLRMGDGNKMAVFAWPLKWGCLVTLTPPYRTGNPPKHVHSGKTEEAITHVVPHFTIWLCYKFSAFV